MMKASTLLPTLLAVLAPLPAFTQDASPDTPFPPSTALAEGVSPDALAQLDALVQSFVDDEEVVGAELMLVKNGRTILHAGYGWADRDADVALEPGRLFCVRSMTKPLIGTAILMLVDDKVLKLDDRVAKYLPAFDAESTRDITLEMLLTHTSGLPMSHLLGKDLTELEGIGDVAALGAGGELEFEPGAGFNYSDQGTDTLTAVLEIASGMPAAEFVQTRILDPLGMRDSACVLTEDHPLRARAIPKYSGSRGMWQKYWGVEDRELFPFFLGSQGLYATLADYARFLELWRTRGRAAEGRLLGARYVRKALRPGPHAMDGRTGFAGLRANYGYLMQVWTQNEPDGEPGDVVAFGHTGSDGTHAWVFPEQNAMALYFTQSRGNATGIRVEEALSQLFLGTPFNPNEVAPPLEEYLGYYWEEEGDLYRAIVRDDDGLGLDILAKGVVPMTYVGDDGWKLDPDPSTVLRFRRSPDGVVTGYHIGDHEEYRFTPSADLPSVDDLAERVLATHGLGRLEELGSLRLAGTIEMPKLGLQGEFTGLLAPGRYRIDSTMKGQHERVAFDGEVVRYQGPDKPLEVLEGLRAELGAREHLAARLGDFRRWHTDLTVIQRLEKPADGDSEAEEVFVVRAGDLASPGRTFYVHSSGRVIREDSTTYVETLGVLGQRIEYDDFRDVDGLLLPHRTSIKLAYSLIGEIISTIESAETGVDVPEGAFELRD